MAVLNEWNEKRNLSSILLTFSNLIQFSLPIHYAFDGSIQEMNNTLVVLNPPYAFWVNICGGIRKSWQDSYL